MPTPSAPARAGDPWEMALRQFHGAADHLRLDPGVRELLSRPRREFTVHFPVEMDDGSVRTFTGYRIWHSPALGPTKGALHRLPYGGAKGGVACDPRALSRAELERLTRRYATEISPLIADGSDIPAPDVGTDAQVMAWFMDTCSMHRGYSVPAVVTGKPVSIGGSAGRAEATGRGVMIAAREAARDCGMRLAGSRVVVQGFGNVGSVAARLMHAEGCRIVGVSDVCG